jgi:hypothetical protein
MMALKAIYPDVIGLNLPTVLCVQVCQLLSEAGVKNPVVQVERDGNILAFNGVLSAGAPTFIKIQ